MFHVALSQGSVFTGQHATLWDLSEEDLRARVLGPRASAQDIWVEGQPFDWARTTARIYEGPPTQDIPDHSTILGPAAYEVGGVLSEVTDRFIVGPPGGDAVPTSSTVDLSGRQDVFVVHGANVAWREHTARFLEQILGPEHAVCILHEASNRGQTIVEKLERAGREARFAVVLLTGDDEGRRQGDDELESRARQNVVFEMGYFFAALGRSNVCVLYEAGVELPSDVHGVVYVPLDESEGWKLKLFRELKSANLNVALA